MNQNEKRKILWKQRITLLMVLVFCCLVAGLEYLPQEELVSSSKSEVNQSSSENSDSQTFLSVAVDAVVPFVTTMAQQIFYLIYELSIDERESDFRVPPSIALTNPLWEILFERIISPNAP